MLKRSEAVHLSFEDILMSIVSMISDGAMAATYSMCRSDWRKLYFLTNFSLFFLELQKIYYFTFHKLSGLILY